MNPASAVIMPVGVDEVIGISRRHMVAVMTRPSRDRNTIQFPSVSVDRFASSCSVNEGLLYGRPVAAKAYCKGIGVVMLPRLVPPGAELATVFTSHGCHHFRQLTWVTS